MTSDSESFLVCMFSCSPSQSERYRFNRLVNYDHIGEIITEIGFSNLFRGWSFTSFTETRAFAESYRSFFENLRQAFREMLHINGIKFYLGSPDKIPLTILLGMSRESRQLKSVFGRNDDRNTFWRAMDIPATEDSPRDYSFAFIDEDRTFIIPSRTLSEDSQPEDSTTMVVNLPNLKVPKGYRSTEVYLTDAIIDWQGVMQTGSCYQSFLDYIYFQLRALRGDYYRERNNNHPSNRRIQRILRKTEKYYYWHTLYGQEYEPPAQHEIRFSGFPALQRASPHSTSKVLWIDYRKEEIKQKREALDRLMGFYSSNILGYRDLLLTASNWRIQVWITLLTIVTIVVAVLQLVGPRKLRMILWLIIREATRVFGT